jgi:hypothetical protein
MDSFWIIKVKFLYHCIPGVLSSLAVPPLRVVLFLFCDKLDECEIRLFHNGVGSSIAGVKE